MVFKCIREIFPRIVEYIHIQYLLGMGIRVFSSVEVVSQQYNFYSAQNNTDNSAL